MGSLPVRHRVCEASAAARARAPGGRRRGLPAQAGPFWVAVRDPFPTMTTSAGTRIPPSAFCAHLRHRDGADRARAAPGAVPPLAADAARRRLRARTPRTGGTAGSSARCRAFDRTAAVTHERALLPAGRRYRTRSRSSSAWPRAPPPGSSSDTCARRRSTRRSTGCCAARSSTQRCSASTSGCRARCREPTRVTPANVESAVALMRRVRRRRGGHGPAHRSGRSRPA